MLKELAKQPMPGTGLTEVVFPSIRAAVDLNRRDPAAAVEELRRTLPYDLGVDSAGLTPYYRGLAYLELKSGKDAATQFQKILDNRGVVMTDIYWPLAHLGLARALAQTGDLQDSLAEYREFLELWKNADPDLRILKDAKSEYKKLSASRARSLAERLPLPFRRAMSTTSVGQNPCWTWLSVNFPYFGRALTS